MITLNTAQEMRKYLGDDDGFYTGWTDRCINDLRTLFMKPDIQAVMEVVGTDGSIIDHFDERTLNPGHTTEGGWFVLEEARHRGNDPELIKVGCDMIDWAFARGWDKENGGMLYYTDVYNKPVQEYWHNMKFWWPHDEALIAMTLAYKLTGEERYAIRHDMVRNWAFSHFQDAQHGDWFGYLNKDGSRANTLLPGGHSVSTEWPLFMPSMQDDILRPHHHISGIQHGVNQGTETEFAYIFRFYGTFLNVSAGQQEGALGSRKQKSFRSNPGGTVPEHHVAVPRIRHHPVPENQSFFVTGQSRPCRQKLCPILPLA